MCGIFGVIDPAGGGAADLNRLLPALLPRGPDGEGRFVDHPVAMGMRRLAVIDLAGGDQPLLSRGGRVVAFQNGEIYNHGALRRELEAAGFVFKTHSDTETLAHGYAHWGIDGLLDRLDGMFALAILDRDSRTLHLARDRFGEKPLFYAATAGRFAYSSSLFALAGLGWLPLDPDPAGLDQYLALQYAAGPHTLFRQIRRLEPGQRLETGLDAPAVPTIRRYYRPRLRPQQPVSDADLTALVDAAVRSRMVADVPVGVFLSGGIDSSTIAALAARVQPGVATFSIGFDEPGFDESPYAEAVARCIGSTHHALRFGRADFDGLFDDVTRALDEPLGDQAALPTWLLSRAARQEVTVALSGEGADEIFGGYEHYRQFAPDDPAAAVGRHGDGLRRIRRLADPQLPFTPAGVPHLLSAADRRALTGWSAAAGEAWEDDLAAWLDQATCPLQRACAADLAVSLPDRLLVKVDRVSMGNSLEVRAPFLQTDVVEAGLGLPAGQRMAGAASKRALRRVAAGLLPPAILERPKQVFAVPLHGWLRARVAAAGGAAAYARAHATPGLDAELTGRLLERALAVDSPIANLAFTLCMLMEWHDRLIDALRRLRRNPASAP